MDRVGTIKAGLLAVLTVTFMPHAVAAPCDTPAHRAFDFWLGIWEV